MTIAEIHASDFLTVPEFVAKFPNHGTQASIRWLIFNEASNGLAAAGAICRRGRRVFIRVPVYLNWLAGGQP